MITISTALWHHLLRKCVFPICDDFLVRLMGVGGHAAAAGAQSILLSIIIYSCIFLNIFVYCCILLYIVVYYCI